MWLGQCGEVGLCGRAVIVAQAVDRVSGVIGQFVAVNCVRVVI